MTGKCIRTSTGVAVCFLLLDRLIRARPRARRYVYLIFALVGAVNLVFLSAHLGVVNRQMAPLRRLLSDIKIEIREGEIGPEDPIGIDDTVIDRLPPLCWNRDMGRFMRGTYHWLWRWAPPAGEGEDGSEPVRPESEQ